MKIELKPSKVESNLIAIVGKNGSGKTKFLNDVWNRDVEIEGYKGYPFNFNDAGALKNPSYNSFQNYKNEIIYTYNQYLDTLSSPIDGIIDEMFLEDTESLSVFDFYKNIGGNLGILTCKILNLMAFCDRNIVIVIDNFEDGLHPTTVVKLIGFLEWFTKKKDCICILSTHSPIVLQNIPHTRCMKIFNNEISKIEKITFGKELGEINDQIFGLEENRTMFYNKTLEIIQNNPNITFDEFLEEYGGIVEESSIISAITEIKE